MAPKTRTAKKRGRPPVPNRRALVVSICAEVSAGALVKDACADAGITRKTLGEWCANDAELGALYARAREEQAHALAEIAYAIAQGDDELTQAREEAVEEAALELQGKQDKNWYRKVQELRAGIIQRDKMRVDTLKWLASKIAPRHYGDRLQQEISGANGGPIEVRVKIAREGRRVTAS